MTETTTRRYPEGEAARARMRDLLLGRAMREAYAKAQIQGFSMKCAGTSSGGTGPIHADTEGGCANDGSDCLCYCHDQSGLAGNFQGRTVEGRTP